MAQRVLISLLFFSLAACNQITSTPTVTIAVTTPPSIIATATYVPVPTSLPSPTISPTPGCPNTHGKVLDDEYQGINVNTKVEILVYLPPCYDEDKTYPTLYLLHGKPLDRHHWISLGVDKAVDSIIQSRPSKEFIVIMPDIPEPLFSSTDGGDWSYEEELTDGLLPHIESSYSVIRSPQARAISGISRGGIWSLEIGIQRPDLFGIVVSLSPALGVNYPKPEYDPYYLITHASTHPRFLLVAGETDWAKEKTIHFAKFLVQQGIESELKVVNGGHDAQTWISATPGMLLFVTKEW